MAGVVALALAASACGGDDPQTNPEPPPTSPTTASTEVPPTTQPPTTAPPTTVPPATTEPVPPTFVFPANVEEITNGPGSLRIPVPLPPGNPGELIDVEELGTFNGIDTYRVMYHSRSRQNEDIAVSGFLLAPEGEAPEGGWPVLAYAHGTTGTADQCAPSDGIEDVIISSSTLEDAIADAINNPGELEGLLLRQIVEAGYAVAATDYEGLGTPGLHTYLVGKSAANTVIDSVRAARNLPQMQASKSWLTVGLSQGGHAALHAGQYWQEYAPELDLLGVISLASPSQTDLIYTVLAGSDARGYLLMAMAAFSDAYEELEVTEILTEQGKDLLKELENVCSTEFLDQAKAFAIDELVAVDNPFATEPWRSIVADNDVNKRPIPAPTLLVHGGGDTLIPMIGSTLLNGQLCNLDGQGPTTLEIYPGATHTGVVGDALEDILLWMDSRVAGEAVVGGC